VLARQMLGPLGTIAVAHDSSRTSLFATSPAAQPAGL
jgi:hypothetical protein